MAFKKLLLALSTLACASAMAQATLGTVRNVQGVVTATQGTSGAAVANGMTIVNGTRLVTTTGGSVTLQLNSGCVVTLQPNQAVTVMQSMTCEQLASAVRPVVLAGPAVVNPGTATVVNGVVMVGGAAVVVRFIRAATENEPLSPS